MDVKPVDDNATREPMGNSPHFSLPTRQRPNSGQLPTREVEALCAQVKGTIAALTRISDHCTRARNEIERFVNELADMIGKA